MHQNCFQVYLTSVFYPVENPYSYEFSGKDVIDVVAQTKQVKSNALQLDIKPLFIFENLKSKKRFPNKNQLWSQIEATRLKLLSPIFVVNHLHDSFMTHSLRLYLTET